MRYSSLVCWRCSAGVSELDDKRVERGTGNGGNGETGETGNGKRWASVDDTPTQHTPKYANYKLGEGQRVLRSCNRLG